MKGIKMINNIYSNDTCGCSCCKDECNNCDCCQ